MDEDPPKRRGGPRTFDRDVALEAAMRLFWRHGYEGTSLADLTRAMGIAPPSLYAAFGSKAGLYREALDRYAAADRQVDMGGGATLHDGLRHLLRRAADAVTDPATESGCMISFGLVEHGPGVADVARAAAEQRAATRRRLAELLSRWLDDADARRRAQLLATILGGMAIAARDGAGRDELRVIADDAATAISHM